MSLVGGRPRDDCNDPLEMHCCSSYQAFLGKKYCYRVFKVLSVIGIAPFHFHRIFHCDRVFFIKGT